MCCGSRRVSSSGTSSSEVTGWVVTYPDGTKQSKSTEVAARMAAALVPGASYAKVGSSE